MPQTLFPSLLCPSQEVTEDQLATDRAVLALDQTVHSVNRRSFFSSLSALGAIAAAGALAAAAPRAQAQSAAGPSIIDVLNFALNLEFLEANLYIAASGAAPIPAVAGGNTGHVMGAPANFKFNDSITQATFQNLAADETHHIETLYAVITEMGGTPISQPAIDYTMGGKMNITTQAQLLAVARQLTAVGNSAYAGAAQYLVSNPLVLTGAAQILGAEAQHLGGLGALCAVQGVMSPAVDALDFPPAPPTKAFTLTAPTLPPLDGPALGPSRTVQQVLGIAYGVSTASTVTPPAGVMKGGFFPNGANGALTST